MAVRGGIAENDRELTCARTSEDREGAKARGVKLGRKSKLTDYQKRGAMRRRARGDETRQQDCETDVTETEDQHYVPQFFLKAWCGTNGKLMVYSRRPGQVVTSLRNPKGTAYAENLYSLEQGAPKKRHVIETEFTTPQIDTPAALIVRKILGRGFSKLTVDEGSDFVRFLLSLRARQPDAVRLAREKGPEELTAALKRDHEEYLAVKGQSSAPTLVDWVQQNAPSLIPNFGISHLPRLITDKRIGERVFSMSWWVHDVRGADIDLLLSDRPCLLVGSAIAGDCLIVLPLSPTMLFFACNNEQTKRMLQSMQITKLVEAVNETSVTSAVERVYATGTHHLHLVERYLAK